MSEEKTIEKLEEQPADLKSLVEKNIKWSQVIYEQNRKIKRRLDLIIWGGVLKWLLILLPLVLALIYLPPLFKDLMGQYGTLLKGVGGAGNSGLGGIDLSQVIGNLSQEQINGIMKMIQR